MYLPDIGICQRSLENAVPGGSARTKYGDRFQTGCWSHGRRGGVVIGRNTNRQRSVGDDKQDHGG
jgi:hypothetical protein